MKDQLTALDQLFAQYPQLDKDRMAIWGWSNGGSMTLYAMTHSDRFRAGVAVAPVTNQINYDSIYTERYMGQLKDDATGYAESDVTKSAANLHGALIAGPRHGRRQRALPEQHADDRRVDQGGQAIPADDLSQQDP